MTKTTNKYRTANSVIEIIRARVEEERTNLLGALTEVTIHRARFQLVEKMLAEAEETRGDDE